MIKKIFKKKNHGTDQKRNYHRRPTFFDSVNEMGSNSEAMQDLFGIEVEHGRVFGAELNSDDPNCIPAIVDELFDFILKKRKLEGVFRIPGDVQVMESFVKKIERNKKYNLSEDLKSVYNAGSILKIYFREYPSPLIYKEFFSKSMRDQLARREFSQKNRKKIKKQIQVNVSKSKIALLRKLCVFLIEMDKFNDTTKMDLTNLAVVFSPNIIKSDDDAYLKEFNHFAYIQQFQWMSPAFEEIIRNHEYYLEFEDGTRRESRQFYKLEKPKFEMTKNPKTMVGMNKQKIEKEKKERKKEIRKRFERHPESSGSATMKNTRNNKNHNHNRESTGRSRPATSVFFAGREGNKIREQLFKNQGYLPQERHNHKAPSNRSKRSGSEISNPPEDEKENKNGYHIKKRPLPPNYRRKIKNEAKNDTFRPVSTYVGDIEIENLRKKIQKRRNRRKGK